jgi:transposase
MRKVREILRLKFGGGVPNREIARRIGVAASTVRTTVKRFQAAGLSWPLPEETTDAALEARLFASAGTKQGHRRQVEPDWAAIHRELKGKHATLSILWDEYIDGNPEGYRYSRFCELYRSWEGKLSVTMRQTHVGGDKLIVDYAGDTVPVIADRLTGESGSCLVPARAHHVMPAAATPLLLAANLFVGLSGGALGRPHGSGAS